MEDLQLAVKEVEVLLIELALKAEEEEDLLPEEEEVVDLL